ncbi:MAG TPA: hydroxyacylglutathione hydrolase [Polyangiales bacterium]|nr:hydroxyacylglutathione hydrolase [Polyangiales bacterium]
MLEPMDVEAVPCLSDNYAYLLVDNAGHTIVVDPSEAAPVRAVIERRGLTPVGIWATHHHHDHVGGIAELVQSFRGLEVLGSGYDAEHDRIPALTRAVNPDDAVWFESRRVRLLFVPGHTLGAVAYLCDGALFSGDTLFGAGCGRMFEGTPSVMQSSLAALRALPPETRLYCGHEYTESNLRFAQHIEPNNPAIAERVARVREKRALGKPSVPSTIEEECATNPFLRWDEPAVIDQAVNLGAKSREAADVFGALRAGKDKF